MRIIKELLFDIMILPCGEYGEKSLLQIISFILIIEIIDIVMRVF